MKKLKPLQLLIGSIPLHKKVILQVHSDSCFINMIFKHNNPEVHLWDSHTEFSLKHANNPDTLVIDHFYFKDGYPNQLEAEVTDNGFRIADLQIMGVMQVETNVGMVNAIFTFAGLPESETDNFEYVNFAENAQGGG